MSTLGFHSGSLTWVHVVYKGDSGVGRGLVGLCLGLMDRMSGQRMVERQLFVDCGSLIAFVPPDMRPVRHA